MMQSMTGFAAAERSDGDLTVAAEIRSYNSRYLDLTIRLPQSYLSMEERIKAMVSGAITRGRVEVRLQIRDDSHAAQAFEVDTAIADSYYDALRTLRDRFGIDEPIPLSLLSGAGGIIRPRESAPDLEAGWPAIRECIAAALADFTAMREREGAFIAADFQQRLTTIESAIEAIEAASDGLLVQYRQRLEERIGALTDGITEIDPARIAQEAAFLADRSDISEEIVRARSHLAQFRKTMTAGEPAGRKLNFLLQEFNREFNTIGSKTGKADVSHRVVAVKSELEKIREQVQNLE